jgi:xylan 1,4-beta-xylosidase
VCRVEFFSRELNINPLNRIRLLLLISTLVVSLYGQQAATIRVNAAQKLGPFFSIYSYFGYDEPNYTYTANGTKLIRELAELSNTPVYIRTHFMLATGDGTPGLKWGSTNAYTEDASGHPIYDWTITDRIFDTYLNNGAKPFVEIGFMPQALSSKPDPYKPTWTPGAPNRDYASGWSYPPRDYNKWEELVYQWVRHCVEKYGRAQVESWYWEVWNEPDIFYWHGTVDDYEKLYDYTAAGLKRALPTARIGGPAVTGPANQRAATFFRHFLEHCDTGRNYASGQSGSPLDFITYHAKGRPSVVEGHIRMGMAQQTRDVDAGFQIVSSFAKFRDLPIVLSESDPEGCAACSARVYPPNAYRNGTLYPAYTAVMTKNILDLAKQEHTNIAGMLTWAFEFENQPYFDGFRTLATNGVDKPVLNVFRMLGLMHGDRVETESNKEVPLQTILSDGVRSEPDVDGIAVAGDHELSVLIWNYHDDEVSVPPTKVQVELNGLPSNASRVLLRQYRIDETHSNAWTAWKKMGSPQQPSPEQYADLERAGALQQFESPRWISLKEGGGNIDVELPRESVALVQVTW